MTAHLLAAALDSEAAAHLALALRVHADQLAKRGWPCPPVLGRLQELALEIANTGQEGTDEDEKPDASEPQLTVPVDEGISSLSPAQVARRLGVSGRTVSRLQAAGDLCGLKVGGCRRFEPAEVERFIKARKEAERGR